MVHLFESSIAYKLDEGIFMILAVETDVGKPPSHYGVGLFVAIELLNAIPSLTGRRQGIRLPDHPESVTLDPVQ